MYTSYAKMYGEAAVVDRFNLLEVEYFNGPNCKVDIGRYNELLAECNLFNYMLLTDPISHRVELEKLYQKGHSVNVLIEVKNHSDLAVLNYWVYHGLFHGMVSTTLQSTGVLIKSVKYNPQLKIYTSPYKYRHFEMTNRSATSMLQHAKDQEAVHIRKTP
jgi:hypothetical protein